MSYTCPIYHSGWVTLKGFQWIVTFLGDGFVASLIPFSQTCSLLLKIVSSKTATRSAQPKNNNVQVFLNEVQYLAADVNKHKVASPLIKWLNKTAHATDPTSQDRWPPTERSRFD